MKRFIPLFLIVAILAAWALPARADEYDFSIPEAEKSPFEFGGRIEFRYTNHWLKSDSARYRLNYYNDDPGPTTDEWSPKLELNASYSLEKIQFHFLSHHEYTENYAGGDQTNRLYQAYASIKESPNLTIEIGKKSFLWGKGYAWNPAGFINRPKDPDDPELNLEGRTSLHVEYIKSFADSSLNNLALSFLFMPVFGDWANPEWGETGDVNAAVKLYLLWFDTDIDFIFFDGTTQADSYGFDFAKNLAENFEVHGEVGFKRGVDHLVLDQSGKGVWSKEDQLSYMAGIRYLNQYETTFIAEYYHNGAGYSKNEMSDFFGYQDQAWQNWLLTGDASPLERAARQTRPYYGQRNFGQDYFYLKVSQKEPFGILYFTPWITAIMNLQDYSFNLQPGMSYTIMTNLVANFRMGIPLGSSGTEFGEKQDAAKAEFWVRWYF